VVVRQYEGWFLNKKHKKIHFQSSKTAGTHPYIYMKIFNDFDFSQNINFRAIKPGEQ